MLTKPKNLWTRRSNLFMRQSVQALTACATAHAVCEGCVARPSPQGNGSPSADLTALKTVDRE
jgi:hypothetical protein